MNLTQNDRLKQVTSDTLIVGVDVGSQTHFCRAFDWRGFELSRRVFKFNNTGMGFLACKAIRIFYVVFQTGCDFDEEKFRKDIIRPEAV